MKNRLFITILACLVLMPILTGCMGEEPDELTNKYLLKMGKFNLEQNDGSKAYNFFHEVLDRDPYHIEALYGITLSQDLRVFAFIDGIIDLLFGVIIANPSDAECAQACDRIEECDLYTNTWTTPENCLAKCPFGLQPFMFQKLIDGSSCEHIRDKGTEWITPTSHERCVDICEDLDFCGLINPPTTFTVDECIEHCPWSYVERHSKFYDVGVCNGEDRTAFEHVTIGLQVLFREIGIYIPPQTIKYTDRLLEMPHTYQYALDHYSWTLVDPPLKWDLSGRYSTSELYLSRALAHFFQTFLLLATSVNLEMNFPSFDLNLNYAEPEGFEEIWHNLIRVIEILLYDPIFPLGFQLWDEPWAYEQVEQSAYEFGMAFSSFGSMLESLFVETGRTSDRAVGYDDVNRNFNWDADETLTLRIGDAGLSFNRAQAEEIAYLCRQMETSFLENEPYDLNGLNNLLEAFGLGDLHYIIDLLASWFPDGMLDVSQPLYEPTKDGFRSLLEKVLEKMRLIEKLFMEDNLLASAAPE